MAANIAPIFCKQAAHGWDKLLTGNTTRDGASGTVYLIFTADATNGSRVTKVILQPLGTNVATVVRLFLNNGSATTTATNNVMIDEIGMGGTTASETAALTATEVTLDLPMKPGFKLYAVTGTTIAAGIAVSAHGGDY